MPTVARWCNGRRISRDAIINMWLFYISARIPHTAFPQIATSIALPPIAVQFGRQAVRLTADHYFQMGADPPGRPKTKNQQHRDGCDRALDRRKNDTTNYENDDACCKGGLHTDHNSDCTKALNSIQSDADVIELLNEIPSDCRNRIKLRCSCCNHPAVAYFSPDGVENEISDPDTRIGPLLRICWNNARHIPLWMQKKIMKHELTHALQYCAGLNQPEPGMSDIQKCLKSLAREMEANYCGGFCTNADDCIEQAIHSSCNKWCTDGAWLSDDALDMKREWFDKHVKDRDFCTNRR